MDAAANELHEVLRAVRVLLAAPGNDFAWSSWQGAEGALQELDGLIAALQAGTLPRREDLSILFAPTGPIQEVSLSSGWADEFCDLSRRFDAALKRLYP